MNKTGLVKPPRLRQGDTIGVWSPSFPGGARYPRRLARGVSALEGLGFQVEISPFCKADSGYYSAPPQELASELHSFVLDERIRCVMTTLGGWLSARILPHLDFELIREFPKIHIGYSDIVSLILGIYHRSGLVTFHGPAVLPELGEAGGPRAYTIKQMLSVLMTPEAPRILSSPSTWTDEFLAWGSADIRPRISRGPAIWTGLNAGRAEGPLLGGCLPTVEMLYGTPYFPSLKGSILFLEHEAVGLDQFCAHLTSFRLRNVLDDIAGLMFGRLSRPDYSVAPDVGFREVAVDCLGDCDIPIAWNVDFGHTQPKLTLPIGTRARLEVLDEEVNLTLLETAVV